MTERLTIVGLGEALWDVLPGGKVLGGAPLNVACHAHALLNANRCREGEAPAEPNSAVKQGSAGASPSQNGARGEGIVVSRVGTDALGDEVLRELTRRGMATDFIQRDATHATSTVKVELHGGQPTFDFAPDIAWDHLEVTEALAELAATCDAICYGTLAQRSRQSRETIWEVLDAAMRATRLFDVNLRQGFYDDESVYEGCRRATIVKLNEQELPIVTALLALPAGPPAEQLLRMIDTFRIRGVVLTRGGRGTLLVTPDGEFDPPPVRYPMTPNADAVGAGDACSAGVLVGSLLELPGERIATLANHLGAYVASQPGATPELPQTIVAMIG